jgi:hypothetical protein
MSPIETLVTELLQAQVAPPPVPSEPGEEERWESDFETFMRARMRNVRPLPDNLRPLVNQAMDDWNERESRFLQDSRSEFLESTEQPLKEYSHESVNRDFMLLMIGEDNAQTITVPNIGWVHTFAWILPLADKQNAAKYASIGAAMATIMCCEAMVKWPEVVLNYRLLRSIAMEFLSVEATAEKQHPSRRAGSKIL